MDVGGFIEEGLEVQSETCGCTHSNETQGKVEDGDDRKHQNVVVELLGLGSFTNGGGCEKLLVVVSALLDLRKL